MLLRLVKLLYPALLLPLAAWAEKPAAIRIDVDAGRVVHSMRGGMGASFHAIEKPMLPNRPSGGAVGGSAWGANPPAEDTKAWESLLEHADWMGLDWCRVELEQRMYEPRRREFDWDNPEMRILYRILDWAERRGVDVFLQQMWGNVEWNAHPELRGDHIGIATSGPHSMEDFAYGLGELVHHLTVRKGYKSIKWLSINNEPGFDWGWWLGPDRKPLSITPGLKAVRQELDRRGLRLPLSGPDWTDLPPLQPSRIDFDEYIGAYDLHSYTAYFDGAPCGYPLSTAEQRLRDWAGWAHQRNKPFFLSELGTMAFGFRGRDAGPSTFEALIKDAALVTRGLRAGVDAFNRWSFVNRGDLDGQWQLVDTWDVDEGKLLPRFGPHRNSYAMYGLLTRFTAKNSRTVGAEVAGELDPRGRQVVAAALRSPKDQVTIFVVNESYRDAQAEVSVAGVPNGRPLFRYQIGPAQRDRDDLRVVPSGKFTAARFSDRLPGLSITVYTTYDLRPEQAGVAAE